jgi:RimJ/RimL family protein N-acetyltransferase
MLADARAGARAALRHHGRMARDVPPLHAPTLHDDAIGLRPPGRQDVRALVAACQDPEIARWTRVPNPYTREDAERFLALAELEASTGSGVVCAITEPDDTLVGVIGLHEVDRRRGVGELGYWTAVAARGRGTATRAVLLLRDWAAGELGLAAIEILTHRDNAASARVAQRAGFARTGEVRRVPRMPPGRRDGYLVHRWPPVRPDPGRSDG